MDGFSAIWYDCEGLFTNTSEEQCSCEDECGRYLNIPASIDSMQYCFEVQPDIKSSFNKDKEIILQKELHANYLVKGLNGLSSGFVSLDSSRPWICYWIVHALYLLNKEPIHLYPSFISNLSKMQQPNGGFGGGPNQIAHCAPTYASILCLCTIGTPEALDVINRPNLYSFFLSMKHKLGGYHMHLDGEVDCRCTYTVLSICRLLNILTKEITDGVGDYILSCFSYEGGFGGEPGNEAHGGYNFCALASLLIIGESHRLDIQAQEHWLIRRQMKFEGGFQGRTNKLVDSCYSFWQGSAMAMLSFIKMGGNDIYDLMAWQSSRDITAYSDIYNQINNNDIIVKEIVSNNSSSNNSSSNNNGQSNDEEEEWEEWEEMEEISGHIISATSDYIEETSGLMDYNQTLLQKYILHCGQCFELGGMRDKPGKSRDFYHSCYSLSGLSVSQNCNISSDMNGKPYLAPALVYGDSSNLLKPTSAVYNIGLEKLEFVIKYFQAEQYSNLHSELMSMKTL